MNLTTRIYHEMFRQTNDTNAACAEYRAWLDEHQLSYRQIAANNREMKRFIVLLQLRMKS